MYQFICSEICNARNAVITIVEGIGAIARIQYRVNYTADDLKRKQWLLDDLVNRVQ